MPISDATSHLHLSPFPLCSRSSTQRRPLAARTKWDGFRLQAPLSPSGREDHPVNAGGPTPHRSLNLSNGLTRELSIGSDRRRSWQEIATACKLVSSSDVQRRFMGTRTRRQGESGDAHGYAGRMRLFSGPLSMFGAKAQISALEKVWTSTSSWCRSTGAASTSRSTRTCCGSTPNAKSLCDSTETSRSSIPRQIFEYFEHLQPSPALWPARPAAGPRARLLEHKSDEVYFPQISA